MLFVELFCLQGGFDSAKGLFPRCHGFVRLGAWLVPPPCADVLVMKL